VDLALVVNTEKRSTLRVLAQLRDAVPRGHRLLLWAPAAAALRERADCHDELNGYETVDDIHAGEVVLALGGDGTLLSAVRLLRDDLRPLLGINLGSLGFLTDTPEERVAEAVGQLLAGRYRLEPRMLVEVRGDAKHAPPTRGLNDVVVHGPSARVIEIALRAGGVDLGSTLADGMIVATPSGSTAYNLSAGGPIVSPRLRALILTPISAHTLSMRPLVVAAEEGIELRLVHASATQVDISVDGHRCGSIAAGESIVVGAAANDLQLVITQDQSFYDTLRTKLGWGLRRRAASS
jgi:NAD+ kinase